MYISHFQITDLSLRQEGSEYFKDSYSYFSDYITEILCLRKCDLNAITWILLSLITYSNLYFYNGVDFYVFNVN